MRTISLNEKFRSGPLNSPLGILVGSAVISWGSLSTLDGSPQFSERSTRASHLYSLNNYRLSIFLIIYLLITIICVVKLVKFERGPLTKRLFGESVIERVR